MDIPRLVVPDSSMADDYLDMNEELRVADDPQFRKGVDKANFSEFVDTLRASELRENVPAQYVPMTTYWLRSPAGRILGELRFRHYLNERLLHEGGHIGYMIRPADRGKGLGTLILQLGLEIALDRKIDRIMLTCDSDNDRSKKVIIRNGGLFDSEGISLHSGKPISRYWIQL